MEKTEIKVCFKYARVSPKKARLIADSVRGEKAILAEESLKFSPTKSAKYIHQLLKSALAAAKEKDLDGEKLSIKEIRVDGGPSLKRRKIRAKGRADIIKRRTSHLTIILADVKAPQKPSKYEDKVESTKTEKNTSKKLTDHKNNKPTITPAAKKGEENGTKSQSRKSKTASK
ncbi:MAG TPA: 50S ribosomal protein L22 [Patescibacteria group bacterium]|uniref:Large ribosomal subunit protein uL22 n=1 Tax=uncultured Berkelbacteria bacterium Rifle_16ft_4_minimus_38443 TaxID=1665092 RepID=A0A0H4TB21_9BACT|nr:50S ribosomal protein L22, large subunit ribosomal protein L22 [uncultured Berkelbacteria bacterium Rifle_16ft_4_minimus_38443]HLC38642.1 50S ribosomal protein L22 [Patescibacteria group bacterium]